MAQPAGTVVMTLRTPCALRSACSLCHLELRRLAPRGRHSNYEAGKKQLADAIELLQNLPARNTIVPDNPQHEAVVRNARDAYEALSRAQKAQVPAQLTLLLEWDESMFDLGFNTEFLPLATKGQPYDGAIYVSGKNGEAGKDASIIEGSLPDGLSLEMDEAGLWARFVGTPERVGSSTFTVQLANDLGECVSKEFTAHVGYAPRITTTALAEATVGTAYSQLVEADAYPDATWSLVEGSLPEGLSFADDGDAANTARIEGTPTAAGTYTFTLACDNFANGIERAEFSIVVTDGATDPAPEQPDARTAAELESLKRQIDELASQNKTLHDQNDTLTAENETLKRTIAELESARSAEAAVNGKVVTAKTVRAALAKAGNAHATTLVIGSKAKRIKAGAFKDTAVRTLIVKSSKLTKKSVKGCLKGSSVKTVRVSVAKAKRAKVKKAYKRIFSKKNVGKKVSVALD